MMQIRPASYENFWGYPQVESREILKANPQQEFCAGNPQISILDMNFHESVLAMALCPSASGQWRRLFDSGY